jgi:PIN domain nuclease of toxin-antitoxin system
MAVKAGVGKLRLPVRGAVDFAERSAIHLGLNWLPLTLDHIRRLQQLPPYHRDPFDRMLIAQALDEQVPIMTSDQQFIRYGIEVIW